MLHITDHAIIRYMERIIGINTDEIRAKIMSETDRIAFKDYEGVLTYSDKSFIIKNGTIITVGKENHYHGSFYNKDHDKLMVKVKSEIIPPHINRRKRKKTFKPRSWR